MLQNITVIIPCKNEQKNIGRCLEALHQFENVIVVDSSSSDNTPSIVQEHKRTYVNFKWNGEYPKKRNWALENVPINTEWVLFLDADEIITTKFTSELVRVLAANNDISGYWLTYKQFFLGKELKFGERQRKLALFRKGEIRYERIEVDGDQYDMEIHEHPVIRGKTKTLDVQIHHDDFRSIEHTIEKHSVYAKWEVSRYRNLQITDKKNFSKRQKVKYSLLKYRALSEIYFIYIYFLRLGILDGIAGLRYALLKRNYFKEIYHLLCHD